MSHGPNVLKKRHTLGAPQPAADVPTSSSTAAAMFAARVRFCEPAQPKREESKEERKRREKEEKREKDKAKSRFPAGMSLDGVFATDPAEVSREGDVARKSSVKTSGRKLSKRR